MFLAPAASSICVAVTAMSGIIAFSFSPHDIVMRSTGMPNLSTTLGSSATKLSNRGSTSPNPTRLTEVSGSRTPFLNAAPYPGAFMRKLVEPPP